MGEQARAPVQRGSYDVVVVGGGVIGLAVAWKLQQRGADVVVLERGPFPVGCRHIPPRGQATWASAGMLAPLAESHSRTPFVDLGLASLQMYPAFAEELSEASGEEVVLQGPGMLRLAEENPERLAAEFAWQSRLDVPLKWLTPSEVVGLEPALDGRAEVGPAVVSPLEKHVPPRLLLHALALAACTAGITLHPYCSVEGFQRQGRRVEAVETPDGLLRCGEVVLAGGAWTGELASRLGLNIPIRPIRGQTVALHCSLLLSHTIYSPSGYLVPRADGTLVVGATQEDVGFTSAPTTEGVQSLLQFATRLVPPLSHCQFEGAWAGLRPATADGLPVLGPAPGWENVHLASGHHRNGILLTPVTARLVADWVLDRKAHPLLTPFTPERFAIEAGSR